MPLPSPSAITDNYVKLTALAVNGDTSIIQGAGGVFTGVIAAPTATATVAGGTADPFAIDVGSVLATIPFKNAIGQSVAILSIGVAPYTALVMNVIGSTLIVDSNGALPGAGITIGSLVVLRDPKFAMTGVTGDCPETNAAGSPMTPLNIANYLEGATTLCSIPNYERTGIAATAGTTTTITSSGAGPFVELNSLIGATVTILTSPATPANVGCTATVASVTSPAPPAAVLALTNFLDANGAAVAQFPGAIAAADTFEISLDLANDLIAKLKGPGADRTTVISALMQFKKKLNPANNDPQLSMNEVHKVAYTNATDTTITVQMDQAAGDLPFPLTGRLRVVDYHTGVGTVKNQGGAFQGEDAGYVAYTRQRRSNVLNLGATGLLAGNFDIGCVVELDPRTSGLSINKGWSTEVATSQTIELILVQTQVAVDHYVTLA